MSRQVRHLFEVYEEYTKNQGCMWKYAERIHLFHLKTVATFTDYYLPMLHGLKILLYHVFVRIIIIV